MNLKEELMTKRDELLYSKREAIIRHYELADYYDDKDLTIICLNDLHDFKESINSIFNNNIMSCIQKTLGINDNLTLIDAFSLLLNKTEHIDYLLDSNLSLKDIKKSQVYSDISACEKFLKEKKLPTKLGQIGNIYKLAYNILPGDEEIHITDVLRNSAEPNVIYSSGVNDLMRLVGNNPFAIKKDYINKNKTPNYNYTLEKAKEPKTLKSTIDSIERNFNHILSINDNADIYTLGAYVPASLQYEEMNIFRELIIRYNIALEKLCKEYNITFIDTESIGKKFNKSKNNFHISSKGHNMIASSILSAMYENKILNKKEQQNRMYFYSSKQFSEDNLQNMILKLAADMFNSQIKTISLEGYAALREEQIADEHFREAKVFQKIYNEKSKGL